MLGGLQIETRNNKLEMQSVNNKSLIEELDKLLERLRIPSEVITHFFLVCECAFCFRMKCTMFTIAPPIQVRTCQNLAFNLLFFLSIAVCDMPYRGLIR